MKLKPIDKSIYRKRLNVIIIAFIIGFAFFALVFGQILIHFFGEVATASLANESQTPPNNFKLNLLGVILGLLVSSFILNYVKHASFFSETYYVWQLKQLHNRIYRKLTKIKALADKGDEEAYTVLSFYYTSIKFVYELDDNTLVISKVNDDIEALNQSIQDANLSIDIENFSVPLLASVEQKIPELKPI